MNCQVSLRNQSLWNLQTVKKNFSYELLRISRRSKSTNQRTQLCMFAVISLSVVNCYLHWQSFVGLFVSFSPACFRICSRLFLVKESVKERVRYRINFLPIWTISLILLFSSNSMFTFMVQQKDNIIIHTCTWLCNPLMCWIAKSNISAVFVCC